MIRFILETVADLGGIPARRYKTVEADVPDLEQEILEFGAVIGAEIVEGGISGWSMTDDELRKQVRKQVRLPRRLLDQVEQGAAYRVARHGRPVAVILPSLVGELIDGILAGDSVIDRDAILSAALRLRSWWGRVGSGVGGA